MDTPDDPISELPAAPGGSPIPHWPTMIPEPPLVSDPRAHELTLSHDQDVIGQVVDHAIVLSTEVQAVFADQYAQYPWWVDFGADTPVFCFERDSPAVFRPQFIGSTATDTNTWLWGWQNVNGYPDAAIAAARRVEELGHHFGLSELTTAYQSLDPAERVGAGLVVREHLEHVFVYCAMAVAGMAAPAIQRPTHEHGHAWLLLDNPHEFSLPTATTTSTSSAISEAIMTGLVQNSRLAVIAYAHRREGVFLRDAEADRLVLRTSDGELEIEFDELHRITGMLGRMGG